MSSRCSPTPQFRSGLFRNSVHCTATNPESKPFRGTRERSSIVQDRIYGAPDIALEILSPHPRIGTLEERVRWFARYGVREIWIYRQPDRALDVLVCTGGLIASRTTFTHGPIASAVLPGFSRSVDSIAGY